MRKGDGYKMSGDRTIGLLVSVVILISFATSHLALGRMNPSTESEHKDQAEKAKKPKGPTGDEQAGPRARWSGSILRLDKDASALTVRKKGGMEKIIHYSSATAWTKKAGGAADPSTLKEGDRVVCHGKYEGDKFVATEIIVQTPK